MYVSNEVAVGAVCLMLGYIARGVQIAISRRIVQRKIDAHNKKIKEASIQSGYCEARTLHPEVKSNINN